MPVRLLFVVNHAGFFLSHRLPLAHAARDAGYDVEIATPKSKHVPMIVAEGFAWHELRLARSTVNPRGEFRTLRDLVRLYRQVRPDLVHHVTAKPVLYGTVAARLTGVRGVINAVSGMGHAFSGSSLTRRALRFVITSGYRVALQHPRMRVIVQNREHRDLFVAERWASEREVVLIPGSGVDVERFAPRGGLRTGTPTVVLASRMLYTKGVADFVEAARELRHRGVAARFVLVGEPDRDNPSSIPAEVLHGWQAEGIVEYRGRRENMAEEFAEADVVCLPTYYAEGVPKVLVEAAACGLPIVTTDWPGCRDVVAHGENGLLVPERQPTALADALAALLTDPEARLRMGAAGRRKITGEFSLAHVVRRTVAIYDELSGRDSQAR